MHRGLAIVLLSVLLMLPGSSSGSAATVVPGSTVLVALEDATALTSRGRTVEWLLPTTNRSSLARRYAAIDGGRNPVETAAEIRALPGVAAAMVAGTRQLFWVPNDPQLGTQWHLQTGNSAGIAVAEAWDTQTGSADVLIAVIDTGVDWSHPDLAANVWQNPGEVGGNGTDDDGNGYVDDLRGWDCGNNDADARPEVFLEMGIDAGFHGTHCAGIVAATTNNGTGVAGTAPGCRIMPLKVSDSNNTVADAAIVSAFAYAIDNGADILSMSFGGPGDGGAAAFYQDLVDQALDAGVVCVAAAGNDNTSAPLYPAACNGVVSVGATDENGNRASFSTYGTWVTVNAPGNRIWATIQTNYSFDFLTGLLLQLSNGWDGVNPYMYSDGTSMACPMVAGVCGLILSQSPGLSPTQVRQVLVDTGDAVSYDQPLGVKVNAAAAVESLGATDVPNVARSVRLSAAPNPFNPQTEISVVIEAAELVNLEIVDVRGRRVRRLWSGSALSAGRHTITWDGRDDGGRDQPSGLYLARIVTSEEADTVKLLLAR